MISQNWLVWAIRLFPGSPRRCVQSEWAIACPAGSSYWSSFLLFCTKPIQKSRDLRQNTRPAKWPRKNTLMLCYVVKYMLSTCFGSQWGFLQYCHKMELVDLVPLWVLLPRGRSTSFYVNIADRNAHVFHQVWRTAAFSRIQHRQLTWHCH